MIKCNVTIIGTISRNGESRTDKEGRPYSTFGIQSVIKAKSGINKTIDISVSKDGHLDTSMNFSTGKRIKIDGILTFRKRDETIYYNLSAKNIDFNVQSEDSINGTITFRGTTGSKDIAEKESKKGNYRIFDAYRSEKTDENNYTYIWVHFVDFSSERPAFLQPKVGIDAEGVLELTIYNGKENIGCLVKTISQWDKQSSNG